MSVGAGGFSVITAPRPCFNCGNAVYAKDRCRNCYVYWMRHGTERPEDVRLSLARRRLEHELMRATWGPLARSLAE